MQHKKNRGFTLIELVVVIAILGILAAFVLPKLANLTEDAHRANVQATRGAFISAVNLVQAQWVAQGRQNNVDDLNGFGTNDLNLSATGWPVGTNGTSNTTTMNNTRCSEIWGGVLTDQAPTVGAGATFDYGVSGSGNVCTYTYQGGGSTTRTIIYDASTGLVTGSDN